MPACPNCGRRAHRTKDWVCEWCGYPLLYGNFKKLDKTYKELQEERNLSGPLPEPEDERELEPEREEPPEPAPPESRWQQRRTPESEYKPQRPPEREDRPPPPLVRQQEEFVQPQRPPPAAEPPPSPPVVETYPPPQPAPAPRAEVEPLPRASTDQVIPLGPGTRQALPPEHTRREPAAQPTPPPAAKPEIVVPPPSPPVALPDVNSINEGSQLTIDQLDGLFQTDRAAISSRLKDKTIILQGIVNKVFIRDHIDVRYILMGGTRKKNWEVRCSFTKEAMAPMSRLKEGESTVIRGKYDGYSRNIIFKECSVVG